MLPISVKLNFLWQLMAKLVKYPFNISTFISKHPVKANSEICFEICLKIIAEYVYKYGPPV